MLLASRWKTHEYIGFSYILTSFHKSVGRPRSLTSLYQPTSFQAIGDMEKKRLENSVRLGAKAQYLWLDNSGMAGITGRLEKASRLTLAIGCGISGAVG
jgi:hypothetical protein